MRTKIRVEVWAQLLFGALGLGSGCADEGRSAIPPSGTTGEDTSVCANDAGVQPDLRCVDSVPAGPMEAGFERCASGLVHRVAKTTCSSRVPRADIQLPPNAEGPSYQCKTDLDCGTNGYCNVYPAYGTSVCQKGCLADGDCAASEICKCGDPMGTCVAATCTSDADCADGLLCAQFGVCRSVVLAGVAFGCQTPMDQCATDSDCARACGTGMGTDWRCALGYSGQGQSCFNYGRSGVCSIGRPFLVGGIERIASSEGRTDWSLETEEEVRESGCVRRVLAEAWTQMALMEHASIAAFARFTLQLLALGAPSQLVERANLAQADETRHAKFCFARASAYAGCAIGPGPLRIDGSLDSDSFRDIVVNVIHEGCIGETVAALEAAEAAMHARDPRVRRGLDSIAQDELAHAALAWRFVEWALSVGDSEVELAVRQAFEQASASESAALSSDANVTHDEMSLLRAGILPSRHRSSLRASAMKSVVAPCATRLLAKGVAPASRDVA